MQARRPIMINIQIDIKKMINCNFIYTNVIVMCLQQVNAEPDAHNHGDTRAFAIIFF